ncbi:MAG TPA: hypothetical protein VK081_04285 [Planctomycetota bacterium]|nr:hypothetical protein [Planctomycetota bacterium]
MHRLLCVPLALVCALPLTAQRRGKPEAILERVACYFVDAALLGVQADDGKDRLAAIPAVRAARADGHPVFVYLFDSTATEPKREGFDKIVFGNEEIGIALRCFRAVRVDLAGDAEGKAKWGRKLPVFVAYDAAGKSAGEVSLAGYKAQINPVMNLLERAAHGRVKPTLEAFVASYRDIVRGLEVLHGRRETLRGRRERADDKKKPLLDQEARELDAEEQRLLQAEQDLLERVKPPPRDPAAGRIISDSRGR